MTTLNFFDSGNFQIYGTCISTHQRSGGIMGFGECIEVLRNQRSGVNKQRKLIKTGSKQKMEDGVECNCVLYVINLNRDSEAGIQ